MIAKKARFLGSTETEQSQMVIEAFLDPWGGARLNGSTRDYLVNLGRYVRLLRK